MGNNAHYVLRLCEQQPRGIFECVFRVQRPEHLSVIVGSVGSSDFFRRVPLVLSDTEINMYYSRFVV